MAIAAANLIAMRARRDARRAVEFRALSECLACGAAQTCGTMRKPRAASLARCRWRSCRPAFWSLDPERTVRKFAEFGRLDPQSAEARRFVELEDWANEGEPLPYPAAKELIEDLFERDLPGSGLWRIASQTMTDDLDVPLLNLTAARDRIAPAVTAPAGDRIDIATGHVGMIVGSARERLHAALAKFLKT